MRWPASKPLHQLRGAILIAGHAHREPSQVAGGEACLLPGERAEPLFALCTSTLAGTCFARSEATSPHTL